MSACPQVILTPTSHVAFVPHPLHDGGCYTNLEDLRTRLSGEGYSGGIRLLKVPVPRCLLNLLNRIDSVIRANAKGE